MSENHGTINRPRTHEDLQRMGIYRALQRIADLPKQSGIDTTQAANWAMAIAREAIAQSAVADSSAALPGMIDRECGHSELYEALEKAKAFVQSEWIARQGSIEACEADLQECHKLSEIIDKALAHARRELSSTDNKVSPDLKSGRSETE